MVLTPCVPADWNEFSVVRKWRGSTYEITVTNPDKVMKGVKSISIDGQTVEKIPVCNDGKTHKVAVVMG